MAVLIPSNEIAARWNGALKARLRREPLDLFLRFQGLPVNPSGPACITDNLARGAMFFVDCGLRAGPKLPALENLEVFRATLGRTVCAVSDGLATLIDEGGSWRSAAMVATAQLLTRFVGARAAAQAATAAAHEYDASFKDLAPDVALQDISHQVACAVRGNDSVEFNLAVRLISQHLQPQRRVAPRSLSYCALLVDLVGAKLSP